MRSFRLSASVTMLALLAGGVASAPAQAATYDEKTISATRCQALGPGTTVSELTINSYGIFNPGDTNEQVICALPGDSETDWAANTTASAKVEVYYRAGSVPGKVTCTAMVGSTVVNSGIIYTAAYNPPNSSAGGRGGFIIFLYEKSGLYDSAPPANLVCTITPKAALGLINFHEILTTNTP